MMAQHFYSCWNVPEVSRVSKRMLGLNLSEEEEEGEGRGWRYFEDVPIVQSPVSGFGTIISALMNLWAQSKTDISVPFSSQSHDVWVYIIFTSVLYLFLLGVLKQPNWPHFKKEKGGTYPEAPLQEEVAQGDKPPLRAHSPSLSKNIPFFPLGSSQDEKCSVALEQTFVDSCLTPTIAWWGCWGEEEPRCPSEGCQAAHDRGGHTACVFQILWGSSLDPSGLPHFSAQMWKLLHTASRDLDLPS